MGRDRKIDPETKGYVLDGQGGYEMVDSVETALHHQIHTERGKWPLDHTKGSLLHSIAKMTANDATLALLEDDLRGALQALIDAGLARSQRVEVQLSQAVIDRILWLAELVDRDAQTVDLSEVGGT